MGGEWVHTPIHYKADCIEKDSSQKERAFTCSSSSTVYRWSCHYRRLYTTLLLLSVSLRAPEAAAVVVAGSPPYTYIQCVLILTAAGCWLTANYYRGAAARLLRALFGRSIDRTWRRPATCAILLSIWFMKFQFSMRTFYFIFFAHELLLLLLL